jgi:hypothetical protein
MVPPRTPSFSVISEDLGESVRAKPAPTAKKMGTPGLHCGASGEVAQLVEHTAENRGVAGSIPALAISLRLRNTP